VYLGGTGEAWNELTDQPSELSPVNSTSAWVCCICYSMRHSRNSGVAVFVFTVLFVLRGWWYVVDALSRVASYGALWHVPPQLLGSDVFGGKRYCDKPTSRRQLRY
jgi:hypothetical protein